MQFNAEDPIVQSAVFGKQVESFLNSDIGRYLIGRAEEEVDRATEQLKKTLPWRTSRIRELQNQILTAERFQRWLGDAVIDGSQAIKLLEDEE